MYNIYPRPKKLSFHNGFLKKPHLWKVFLNPNFENVFTSLESFFCVEQTTNIDEANIIYNLINDIDSEGYRLKVSSEKIIIEYHDRAGAFYATQTLKQISDQSGDTIRCLQIEDHPDLAIRGFMLDISRNKIPTLESIYAIIDLMGFLKMNHFELYVEGFSYGYPSFSIYWEDGTPITVDDYKKIENYCAQNEIDFVPNQNGFGHMAPWLATEEYADLAESPDGIYLWGTQRAPSTLNPLDPRSIELISKMYADMLPHSKSKYFNMNFDEPFELGTHHSKEHCEKVGLGNVYVDFVLKAYAEIKKYNKQPLIWGDVLLRHPEVLPRLPDDMIFIDWGYDGNYPFSENLKKISELGIKFMAAPGTTSWCSMTGRSLDMIMNIYNACLYTKKFNGEGILLTDWGDFGHLQFWPVSLMPLTLASLLSWRTNEKAIFDLKHVANKYVFKDKTNLMADLMLDFGSYNRFENYYMSNGTQTFYSFIWANFALKEDDPIAYFQEKIKFNQLSLIQYNLLQDHFKDIIARLKLVEMIREDSQLIKAEIIQSIELLSTIQKVNLSFNNEVDLSIRRKYLQEAIDSERDLIANQKKLWLQRNRLSELQSSLDVIEGFIQFAKLHMKGLLNLRGEGNEV